MSVLTTSIAAGACGATTTTLLHELTRRLVPDAPRVDLLGMQALAAVLRRAGVQPPEGQSLFNLTLAGDLVSNTAYFSLAGVGPRDKAIPVGVALGLAAGLGAVYLPPSLNLSALPTRRSATTATLTVALYTAGGLVAGATSRTLAD